MTSRRKSYKVLVYSHDSFGLGHLRRCRTIAHALVERYKDVSVLILSGSPIVGSFDFRTRVDFVRVPGVIKLRNGEYSPLSLHMDITEVVALRASIIEHTAEVFSPDLFLVDKEPLGLRGEIRPTLELLAARGTPSVLGLRDVMDDPALLAEEWARKDPVPALEHLYHSIWVYGLPQICEPLDAIDLPSAVREKIHYTGYPRIHVPQAGPAETSLDVRPGEYLLVTAGGGGDGDELIDWVIAAYEHQPSLDQRMLLVFGPFMAPSQRDGFRQRLERFPQVEAITFDSRLEAWLAEAAGVIAMGGYNTFCEILSFDRPAVIVPRVRPRREQHIRAESAARLGLVGLLPQEQAAQPALMAEAIRTVAQRPRPSAHPVAGLLDGLDNVARLARALLDS